MEYNCKDCESFWKDIVELPDVLKELLEDISDYLKLYCPKCKRSERSW